MKSDKIIMLGAIFSLLGVVWLSFHDVFEPHNMRDWLILFSTILVFWHFVMDLSRKKK
ncbi:MAG TPA: hypothetical protein VKC53_00840 [Patescibacteria group bacterium]|nr:hypothetical protein [Patescibacteria group bacterium]